MALLDQDAGPVRGLLMAEVPGIVERNIARLFRDGSQDEEPAPVNDPHPSMHNDGSGDSANQQESGDESRTVQTPAITSSYLDHIVEAGPSQPRLQSVWDSEPMTAVPREQNTLMSGEITSFDIFTVPDLDSYPWLDCTTSDERRYDYIGLQNFRSGLDQIHQEPIMESDNGTLSNRSSAVGVAS